MNAQERQEQGQAIAGQSGDPLDVVIISLFGVESQIFPSLLPSLPIATIILYVAGSTSPGIIASSWIPISTQRFRRTFQRMAFTADNIPTPIIHNSGSTAPTTAEQILYKTTTIVTTPGSPSNVGQSVTFAAMGTSLLGAIQMENR
jgi:hypothetical protein